MKPILFSELGLLEPIQRSLNTHGYESPTPIQAEAIPHLLAGRDLLGCAQTGTGKTAAFALPILHHLGSRQKPAFPKTPRALILSPTRELAAQISNNFGKYGKHLSFKQTVIYGGVHQNPQVRDLVRGVHVLVATPGRLLDLMDQGFIQLNRLEFFVLDEADRMLDMGFMPDLKKIIALLPKERQSLFFSATLPKSVAELAESLLNNPVRVTIAPESTTADLIDQKVLFVDQVNKNALLHEVLQCPTVSRALIFTKTKRGADQIARQLDRSGIRSDSIHGDKSQAVRSKVLQGFKMGRLRVLVATDVAARGIDIDSISHVINFDMPNEAENYVHRIGRTGRAGASGVALSFCDSSERGTLRAIERLTRNKIDVHTDHSFHTKAMETAPNYAEKKRPRRPFTPKGKPRAFAKSGRSRFSR